MHRQFEADNPRPWRCGTFVAATGKQCILEADHAWRCVIEDDLITPEEAIVLAKAEASVAHLVHSIDPAVCALVKAVNDMVAARATSANGVGV
jgi:hypothetical protein